MRLLRSASVSTPSAMIRALICVPKESIETTSARRESLEWTPQIRSRSILMKSGRTSAITSMLA
jgi:hypothetical protein